MSDQHTSKPDEPTPVAVGALPRQDQNTPPEPNDKAAAHTAHSPGFQAPENIAGLMFDVGRGLADVEVQQFPPASRPLLIEILDRISDRRTDGLADLLDEAHAAKDFAVLGVAAAVALRRGSSSQDALAILKRCPDQAVRDAAFGIALSSPLGPGEVGRHLLRHGSISPKVMAANLQHLVRDQRELAVGLAVARRCQNPEDFLVGLSAALTYAAVQARVETVAMLLPPNVPKTSVEQALRVACRLSRLDMVKLLLPISDPDPLSNYVLCGAIESTARSRDPGRVDRIGVIELLLPRCDIRANDEAALVAAVKDQDPAILKMLIEGMHANAASEHAPSPPSRRPLAAAADLGRLEHVELLLPGREAYAAEAMFAAIHSDRRSVALRLQDVLAGQHDVLAKMILRAARIGRLEILEGMLASPGPALISHLAANIEDAGSGAGADMIRAHLDAFELSAAGQRAKRIVSMGGGSQDIASPTAAPDALPATPKKGAML